MTVKVNQPTRVERTYFCQVNVEGRMDIATGTYDYLALENVDRVTSVTVTSKCMIDCTKY